MDGWRRPDGSLDVAAFLQHACSLYGDPAERWAVDLDAVRATTVERPSWHFAAACRGLGTTAFYAPGNTPAIRHALSICATCEVVAECRQAGAGESFGVWGGEAHTQRERRPTAAQWLAVRARRAGRPATPRPGRCGARGRDGVDEWGDMACANAPARGALCNACSKREQRWRLAHAAQSV